MHWMKVIFQQDVPEQSLNSVVSVQLLYLQAAASTVTHNDLFNFVVRSVGHGTRTGISRALFMYSTFFSNVTVPLRSLGSVAITISPRTFDPLDQHSAPTVTCTTMISARGQGACGKVHADACTACCGEASCAQPHNVRLKMTMGSCAQVASIART